MSHDTITMKASPHLQTVHTCPELYKNTFHYYTVKASPPDLDECHQFIESLSTTGGDSKLLVYCMRGTSR
jgi:protein-tyrosine phosphatase